MSSITPGRVWVGFWRWFWTAVCAVALLGAITIGLWQAHWWFFAQNVNRQYSVTVRSQAYQTSLVAEMQQHLSNIMSPSGLALTRARLPVNSPEQEVLRSQELSEVREFCSEGSNLIPQAGIPGSQDLYSIYNKNCIAGVPVSSPPLAQIQP
jgi:hypothetical protein